MLLRNIGRIVTDNYDSLIDEAWGRGPASALLVIAGFGLVPVVLGLLGGYHVPVWVNFLSALISVIGVLTGFSINSIVLLTGHSESDSYSLKTKVVDQTKDYTLYSILVGIVLLITLTLGFLFVKAGFEYSITIRGFQFSILQLVSVIVYSVLAHYVLILLVITHRLYTLVHGNAIGNG